DLFADHHRVESALLAQLLLPADKLLQLAPALDVQMVNHVFGDHEEERQVNRIDAFAQDRALAATLSSRAFVVPARLAEKCAGILEVIAIDHARQRLAGLERLAVTRVHVADLPLRDHYQRQLVYAVLPAPVEQVYA